MLRNKTIIIICLIIVCMVVCTSCANKELSVSGTWEISEYEYDGLVYAASDIMDLCEQCGYSLLEWSETTLKFTKDGSVHMGRNKNGKVYEVAGTYVVEDSFIELVSENGEKKLLDYDGEKIFYDIPLGVTLVFQR